MKFYLDEDLSPKIAKILRAKGMDALSAHEAGMTGVSDQEQLDFAFKHKRCLVTRNRNDFIQLTIQFFNENRPHRGILIIPHTIPGDQFGLMARLIKSFVSQHPSGLEPYQVEFLTKKTTQE